MSRKKERKDTIAFNRIHLDIAAARRIMWRAQKRRDWPTVAVMYGVIGEALEEEEERKGT